MYQPIKYMFIGSVSTLLSQKVYNEFNAFNAKYRFFNGKFVERSKILTIKLYD